MKKKSDFTSEKPKAKLKRNHLIYEKSMERKKPPNQKRT